MRLRGIYIFSGALLTLLSCEVFGQSSSIDRLTTEYKALIQKEESLNKRVLSLKELYRQGGDAATQYRDSIFIAEQQLFDLRALKNAITNEINISSVGVNNLPTTTEHIEITETAEALPSDDDSRSIIDSNYANSILSKSDITTLREAIAQEKRVKLHAKSFISSYNTLLSMREEYAQAAEQVSADSIYVAFTHLDSLNHTIAERIYNEWIEVSDNKSFSYALLLEQREAEDILDKEQSLKVEAARVVDSLSKIGVTSIPFLQYTTSQIAMSQYEILVAQELQLPRAVDSMKYIRDSLLLADNNLPPVYIEQRKFIDFEDIEFSTKPIYTPSNPIPACRIYERGVIYRLLVGSFKTRQAASLFRGAYPISVLKDNLGLFGYYLGGYATLAEAEKAREVLLKHGFKRPEVVEFKDGKPHNLTRHPRPVTAKYRVEINGITEMGESLRSVINSQGAGRELSKIGAQTFVVGLFDDIESAKHLVESLKIMDSSIKVSISAVK